MAEVSERREREHGGLLGWAGRAHRNRKQQRHGNRNRKELAQGTGRNKRRVARRIGALAGASGSLAQRARGWGGWGHTGAASAASAAKQRLGPGGLLAK